MDSPLISCIVPVFNGERFLAQALESILSQTYRPLEVIVIDDGSTDGSADIVARCCSSIHYFRQSNKGPAAARNRGLAAASGDLVAFLDQDDLWHCGKLERQVACFIDDPELSLCVAHVQTIWGSEPYWKAFQSPNHRLSRPAPGYVTGTLLARRSLFETVGMFNSELKYSDAAEWFLRAEELGAKMALLSDILMYRRVHENNFSRLHASASREEFLVIIKKSLDRRRATLESPIEDTFPQPD
jgi:glycosyltransferase involved in cell wall biosynthesis